MARKKRSIKEWSSAFWSCFASKISHPLVGGVEAFLAILTGLAGSLFATEIRCFIADAIAGTTSPKAAAGSSAAIASADGLAGSGPAVFWWMLAATTLLHITRSIATRSVETRLRDDFKRSTMKLEDLVATNPSPDYLRELGLSFEKATVVAAKATTLAEKREAISLTLQTIAKLARVYDVRGKREDTFSANVMWFIPSEHAKPWDDVVAFRGPGATLAGVQGVAALCPEYSATNEKTPDPDAQAFALDVPHEKDAKKRDIGDRERWSVLPGAPLAYLNRKLEHFHPSIDIVDWVREYGNFPPSVADAVGSYFRRNRDIAGFVSIPLFRPMAGYVSSVDRDVVGVLNVHWSKVDILDAYASAEKFSQTIYPICMLLAQQMIDVQTEGGHPVPPPAATTATGA